jgi:hypothetical protein
MKLHRYARRPHRGISLLFALLALVALSLAAVGLVRTVGTGSLVVGNLGFKMDATGAGDLGAERAITWLNTNLSLPLLVTQTPCVTGSVQIGDCDLPTAGYWAASHNAIDPTGQRTTQTPREVIDWAGDGCATVSGAFSSCLAATTPILVGLPPNQNRVSWIITRLCNGGGSLSGLSPPNCANSLASGTVDDANSSALDYSSAGGLGVTTAAPYYRVIVRTVGARNTVSFTETIVHF